MSDYFKKRMEELGLSNEDTSNKKTTSGNNKTTSNYFSERLKALGLDSSSKVDKSYIDSFVKDAQSHLNSKNLSGDISSAYDSWKERDKELRARETAIRDYLENNKDSLTEESYNSIKSFLDDFGMYSSQFSYSLYDANRKASVNPFDSMTSEEVLAEWEKAKAAAAAEAKKNAQKEEETKTNESFWDKLGRYLGGVQDTTLPMGSMPAAPSAPSSSSIQSEIAYTTQDGRNVTWEKLYNNKLADEEFDRLYSQYSTSDDWGKLSQDRDEALGYKSDYDILFELSHSNVPHSADAVENNPDAQYAFQDAEKKRKYIEDKYGVDLHDGYASNTLLDLMNKVGSNDTDNFDFTSYMNEKERSLLNYIFNTQGHDAAAAFHDQREDIYRDRHIDASQKNAMNLGKDSPWLASIGSVALNLGAGLEFVGDTIDQTITGETQYNDLGGFAQGLRGGVMEGTDWNIGDFDAFDFLYGTGMSMADSATSMVMFGGLGGVNLGLSAAGQSYNDAINRGMSADQALKTAMVAGVAEGLFETVSIGKFKALQESGKSGLKNIALDFAKLAVTNASEETLTEITNIAYDILANGGFSQYETSVRQYMNQGLSEEEARKKAGKDLNAQIVEAGASGALMGFGFGGINAAGKTYSTIKSDTNVGKNIISEAESAENFDTVAALKSLAYEMAGEKKNFGDKQLAKTAGKIDYTNLKARQVGKTHRLLSESISKHNAADIQTALVESGVSEKVASRIADSIGTNGIAGLMAEMQKLDLADMTRVEHVIGKVSDPTSSVSVRKQRLEAAEHGVYSPDAAQQTEASPEVLKVEHKVSESGKTLYKNENGEYEEVNKIKIVSTDGDVKVELDNGKTVSAKDLELSTDAEAMAFEMVTRMETTPETAQVIFEAVKASDATSATELFLGVPTAYRYGKINYEAGLEGIRIPDAIKKLAFDRGRNDAASSPKGEKQVSKQQTKNAKATQGKVIFEGFEYSDDKATDMQKASMAGINLLTKMSSLEIHVYASWVENGTRYAMVGGKKREAPNGWHEEGTNKIYIDINAGNYGEGAMLYTLGHEATHYIANWNWDGFKKLGDFLIENFGKHNVPVDILIERKKQTLIKSYQRDGKAVPGENQLFKEAYEEVVAEAMTSMFADPKAYDKLAELKKQDKTLWQKLGEAIKKMLDKLKSLLGVYDNTKSGAREADFVSKFSKDVYEQLQDLYLKAFVEADANYQAWVGGRNVADFAAAESTDGKKMFQYRAMEADEETYRDMLTKWGKMSDTQVANLFLTIDKAMDIIKDNLEALDYAWEADIDDRAFSPVKPNSDKLYQVSLDFSTLCRKRILQQMVQAQLQEALNKPLTREEGIAIRDALIALQEEGRQIEVACALCYVESARMKSPEQIKRFMDNKEAVIKEFFAGKSGGDIKAKIKHAESAAKEKLHKENPNGIKGKDGVTMLDPRTTPLKELPKKYADEIRAAKKLAKESYKPTAEEQELIDAAKGMTVSDFTSPEGLENLAKNYPRLFDAYTSYVRNATKSKGIENDTWWRAGDSMQIGDVLIANMNRENGLRSQSWSDFQVVHILDYIAATIELATRNAKEQAYTKVPDYAELMGNTGVMVNLSLIPPPKFNGSLDYDSVEGMDYKRALQLRDKYHATVGTICIGINNAQIKLLLGDITIDYVIPYHKSGMSKAIRKIMHIPTWDQYEEYQSEKNLSRADALKQANKYGVSLLDKSDPNYQKAPIFSEWFDIKEARQIAKMENANPSDKAKQEKYGVMYGGYMAMQNAANNYLKLCAERGLSPKFSHEKADFTTEENYWKLLIDRKMVDNVTGEVIEQQTIKPIFDESEILRILNDELDRYPGVKADQEYAVRKVTEAYLSGSLRGGMSAEAIAKVMKTPVDNVTTTNIIATAKEIKEFDSSKEKIEQNIEDIAKMYSVADSVKRNFSERSTYAPTFYSYMGKVVDDIKIAKMGAGGVVPYLKGKGVKDEEIKWSGIEAFLDGKKSVTKAELQEFVAGSQLQIEEEMSGKDIDLRYDGSNRAYNLYDENGNVIDTFTYSEFLDGYVSESDEEIYGSEISLREALREEYEKADSPRWADYRIDGGSNYRELVFKMPNSSYSNQAMRTHWGEYAEGVLAHARIQDMTTTDGKKMLFIEEIQSDWHNEGHTEGYGDPKRATDLKLKALALDDANKVERRSLTEILTKHLEGRVDTPEAAAKSLIDFKVDDRNGNIYVHFIRKYDIPIDLVSRMNKLKKSRDEATSLHSQSYELERGVPDAPFRTTYHEYVLKRLIRMAAEEGYDSIGWTTAEMQADRWSEDYAEGYRIEYDQDIPKFLRKYGKKWGATVGHTAINDSASVWSMNITDSMKDSVLNEGQVMYSERDSLGNELSKEQQEFFKDSKVRDTKGRLIPMYHGTKADFTIFDKDKLSDGLGFFFTEDKRESYDYGTPKECYLDISKPFDMFGDIELADFLGGEPKYINGEFNSAAAVKGLIAAGYDGVKAYSHGVLWYIAFSPEQIKLTSNKNPTSNPDIRYQERDPDSISNRSLLANALESAVQEGEERNLLRNYKTNLRLIEAEQAKLADVRQQAYDLRFKKGRTAEETKTLKSLDFEAKQIATRINSYDRELLKIEAMQPIKAVLNREKQMAYKRAEQKGKEALKKQRERASENYKKLLAEKQESRKNAIESRHKTEMRHKIKKVVGDLDHLLRHGSKERNVKLGLQSAVASALEAVNMDTVAADERIAKLKADLMKAKTPEKIQEISRKIDNIQSQGDRMASRLEELRKAYADIRASDDEGITEYYKHEASIIADKVDSVMTKVGNTPLRNMSLSQLEAVYELYQVVLTTVRGANEAFVEGKIEDLHKNVSDIMTEVSELPALKEERLEVGEKAGKIMWNELIPVTAFDRIGSKTFTKFFWELVRGQNTFANDVKEAKEFSSSVREKYGYSKWDLDKVHEFKLTDGRTFRVTLKHMMSIYAYSKRDQALDHMRVGGFFFNDKETFRKEKGILKVIKSNEEGYSVDDLVLESIKGEMSKEQLLYVDEMQDYLTKMGAKGNEVSRVLWGIDIFKEKVYFPLKSSKDFVFQANQTAQETSLKNDGMTKETKPGASNPIVLEAFDDVWANHINRMSQYHSFVIPIENLNKILNYGTWAGTASISVSTMLKSRHTAAAVEYLTNFVKDLNGASVMHGASNPLFSLVGRFKKTAVAASMSVVVQQPTAILRAMAVMDAKYLAHIPALRHLSSKWDELQKYAPIAIIKDIGGFDAGAGRQASEWLNDDTRRGIDKVMGKIDDITMAGAAWGDKVGWCTIWDSVKREIKATTTLKEGSEEFLKKAGERFTEIIVRTQVYDSTLSRSGYMRSKHESVKMMTAFMGEPTVSINMMFDAITQAKRKNITKRQAGRVIGSVYASVVAASVAASLIYALRDDDEEAYLEKFAESLGDKLVDDLIPLNMLPIFRDINSIMDGWDVERTDMAIFKDIKDAFDGLNSENKSVWKKVEDFAGAIGNAFGVPAKNLLRTGREVYNLFENFFDGVNPTWESFGGALTGKKPDKDKSLYDAIISGDEARLAIFRKSYKDDSAYETAVKKALRENDPRIKEAAQADFDGDIEEYNRIVQEIIREGNFDKDDILAAVKSERNDLEPDKEEDDSPATDKEVSIYTVEHYFTAIKSGKTSLANAAKDDIIKTAVANGKSLKEAESSFYESFRKLAKDAYAEGDLSRTEAERMLVNYGNFDENKAYWRLKEWDYYKQNGTTDGYSKFTNFYEAVRTGKNLKAVISEHTSHGDKAETLASQITSYFKPLYKEMSNSERASIKGYLLNAYVQLGYSRAEKNKDINAWLKDKD